jgi:acyl-CoA synthetase (AMP-forming)/AMP-acid ligase II
MNIADILLRRSEELGDDAAIIDVHEGQRRSYSFRELDSATASIASQFKDAGLQVGDGVLLLHPVAAELYLVLIALFCRAGAYQALLQYFSAESVFWKRESTTVAVDDADAAPSVQVFLFRVVSGLTEAGLRGRSESYAGNFFLVS